VKLGGIAQNILNNIVYQFQIFINYRFTVMITSSYGCSNPKLGM
jgi:hypothetical protein